MAEKINYVPLLPKQPEEDVVSIAQEQGAFRMNYLIYRSERMYDPLREEKRDAVLVVCTGCGENFYAEKIRACCERYALTPFGWQHPNTGGAIKGSDHTFCPWCGCEAKATHIGQMRMYSGEVVEDAFVSILTRLPVEGRRDRLALLEWCVRRCINKAGHTRWEIWPFSAWIVEERKMVRLMGHARNIGGAITLFGEWRQRKTFCDTYGKIDILAPWDPAILEGTTAENCKLDLYIKAGGKRLVRYLALWRRCPAVENLMVQGCGKLVETWIKREAESSMDCGRTPKLPEVNWKEKRPSRMLGLNKEEFRHLRQDHWDADDLERYRLVRDFGLTVRLPEDMDLLRYADAYVINKILEEGQTEADFWRILRYLRRQRESWSTLWDYWAMAQTDGQNLTDSLVRWPRDLTAAHQRQIDARRTRREREHAEQLAKEREARRGLFKERAEALEPLAFELNGLLIRPCKTEDELIAEGNALHHCVATYAQSHAEGKTAIFFIRRIKEPDKPFFTLEFDEKQRIVRQNRGMRNCVRTTEVETFEAAWLNWLRSARGKLRTTKEARTA